MSVDQQKTVFLTVDDLAARWHKSVATIRSDASRAPRSVPPICRLPGSNRLLWRLVDVEIFEQSAVQTSPPIAKGSQGRRPGRPTKAEQLRRRMGASV